MNPKHVLSILALTFCLSAAAPIHALAGNDHRCMEISAAPEAPTVFHFPALKSFSLISEARADEAPVLTVPDKDIGQGLVELATNWKSLGVIGIGMLLVTLGTSVLKKLAPEFAYKRLLVTVLGVAYAVLVSVSTGAGPLPALILALGSSGGASSLYEAWKGLSGNSKS